MMSLIQLQHRNVSSSRWAADSVIYIKYISYTNTELAKQCGAGTYHIYSI